PPPSALPGISPARGEIKCGIRSALHRANRFLSAMASKRKTGIGGSADLPPCGGDARQGRGGCLMTSLPAFLTAHPRAVLVEITQAKGSTPRERGAFM